ncbi:MAG: outer membrane beta-barrel protein [Prevotellaceae bacterium]|jgi:hypothetical protein|nr:outer membrane beta-barrel protein [Prevotellaceae bacterium]
MKKILVLSLIIACYSAIYGQYTISSTVFDGATNTVVEGASVRLLNVADSAIINGVITNSEGKFELNNVNSGIYLLEISFFSYKTILEKIEIQTENLTLKPFYLQEDAQVLNEIVVKGQSAQMIIKGDTIEFNANAFKLGENSVVEDLLKKLPGVEITSDGKILVNGQEVKKIRVDGKKFFDGDAEMATKNIPAEMVEKVQVIDQKSEMAQLTGFEDDDTERIINLTFKESKKKGIFGNLNGGIGADMKKNPDLRYDGNGFLNFINNNTQTAIIAGANNINNTRSTRGRGSFGGGNGITTSQNIGITNSTYINPKLTIGGDLMFSHSQNNTESTSEKENFLTRNNFKYSTITNSLSDHYSINGRFELEFKRDSFNTFIFQPNIGYSYSTIDTHENFGIIVGNDTASNGKTDNFSTANNRNGALIFTYNRKSQKRRGRTFTMRLNGGLTFSDDLSTNISQKLDNQGIITDDINQQSNQISQKYSSDIRISYVEPLWNVRNLLELVGGFRSNYTYSDKKQYNFDGNYYSIFNKDYSNKIKNNFLSEIFELNYRLTQAKYNLTLGIHVEPSQTQNFVTYGNDSTRNFYNHTINYAPTARFQYNFGKKHTFRLNYRGRTTQPSVNQLQPVKNNANLMNETVGNPLLNPAFSHNIMMNYSRFNEKNLSSLNLDLMAAATQNALVSNSIFDSSGKQYNQTVNANVIPFNLNFGILYNIAVFKRKLNINTTTRVSYARIYGYTKKNFTQINDLSNLPLGDLSATDNSSVQEQLSLSYSHDIFELGAKGTFRYTNTYNDISNETANIFDYTATGNFILRLPKNFTFSTDINYTVRQGYANFDRNELIWNASLDKGFLKNQLILSLKAFDILHQKQNIRQVVGDNYMQYTTTNTLQSYFLVVLAWKISKFSGMSQSEIDNSSQQRKGRGRGRVMPTENMPEPPKDNIPPPADMPMPPM